MSARDELDLFHAAVADDPRRPARLLDAYRAEVLAEADADLTRLDRELRGRIEHEKAGKARWRARAEKAERRVAELEAERDAVAAALEPRWDLHLDTQVHVAEAVAAARLAAGGESRG
ncbi:hypothetical protein [Streptomyces sp. NRRL F-2664]|uniref:hypothetical protein n=1 Tax=Streptomyces sp. NRRL F-2664 TaxID=1463842 RepID=UPI0004C57D33|nr:hypothetical protein [Streptomyces sp. NRRL F-2664]